MTVNRAQGGGGTGTHALPGGTVTVRSAFRLVAYYVGEMPGRVAPSDPREWTIHGRSVPLSAQPEGYCFVFECANGGAACASARRTHAPLKQECAVVPAVQRVASAAQCSTSFSVRGSKANHGRHFGGKQSGRVPVAGLT